MINSIDNLSAYRVTKDIKTGKINVRYDDKRIFDEETIYQFNPDGSASSRSLAWGYTSQYPSGTFSDLMLKLPKTQELSALTAKQMVDAYRQQQLKQSKITI